MDYKELQTLKDLTQKFINDKPKYDPQDVMVKMNKKVIENMAVIAYRELISKNDKTIEQIMFSEIFRHFDNLHKLHLDGVDYIKFQDLRTVSFNLKERKVLMF